MLTESICCNCRYYEGVHGSAGCAPCEIKKVIVLWSNSCESIWLIPKRLQLKKNEVRFLE